MASIVSGRGRGPVGRFASAVAILLVVLLALLAGAALLVQSRIDPEALRQRIERQCFEATGRRLLLDSAHLRLLPVPTLSATGVVLAGLPGDGRPNMLTAASVSAHLALWPLLHQVARLDGLTLLAPNLLLARDAAGNANWRFQPPPKPAGPDNGASGGGRRWRVEIGSLRVRDASVAWRDAVSGWSGAAVLDRLDAAELGGSAPEMELAGHHGVAGFTATLRTGPLSRLEPVASPDTSPDISPWPLRLSARSDRNGRADATLIVNGTLTDPVRLRGFALDLTLDAPHPDGIDALFPHAAIPATGPVSLSARINDDAAVEAARPVVALRQLSVRAERIDVGAMLRHGWSRGLLLQHVSIQAPDRTAPVSVAADGNWHGRDLSLRGTAGTLDAWRRAVQAIGQERTGGPVDAAAPAAPAPAAPAPAAPFDLVVHAGDASASLSGFADPARLRVAVKAAVPAVRALVPVGPALTGLTLAATLDLLSDRRLRITDLALASNELALSGDATLAGGDHPAIDATLMSSHLDLDALRAGWAEMPSVSGPSVSGAGAGAGFSASTGDAAPGDMPAAPGDMPAPPADAGTAQAAGPAVVSVPVAPGEHAVPFNRLLCCDAVVRFHATALTLDGASYKAVAANLALHDGVLDVSPVAAAGPAGPVEFSVRADATRRRASVSIRPTMLPAATIAKWLHRDPVLQGTVELVAELNASGTSWEAMARDADGHAGLSMVDGTVADSVLGRLIGRPQAEQAGARPDGSNGRTGFRCLALPAMIAGGTATLDPIALATSRLVVGGRGTVSLPDGRLDLHLLPHLAMGATGASLPVRIGGTLEAPEAALDPAATGGRFTLQIGGPAPPDPCQADLKAARFGANGPLPGAGPDAGAADGRRKLPKPIDILRGLGLFR